MTLEEYILMRKKEDGLNEYDVSKRDENIRICTSYILDYFNNHMDNRPESERSFLEKRKQDRYRKLVSKYSPDVQDWLVELNSRTGKYVHKHLLNLMDDRYFLLFSTDAEFRSLSDAIYLQVVDKIRELTGENEMIYNFIRDEHRIQSKFYSWQQTTHITDDIDKWISDTYKEYGVNIFAFCEDWCSDFSLTPDMWEKARKIRKHEYDSHLKKGLSSLSSCLFWDYDYKSDGDRFGLNALYRNMPQTDFTKGKEQAFEAVMMQWWTHSWDNDEIFWESYLNALEEKNY